MWPEKELKQKHNGISHPNLELTKIPMKPNIEMTKIYISVHNKLQEARIMEMERDHLEEQISLEIFENSMR